MARVWVTATLSSVLAVNWNEYVLSDPPFETTTVSVELLKLITPTDCHAITAICTHSVSLCIVQSVYHLSGYACCQIAQGSWLGGMDHMHTAPI